MIVLGLLFFGASLLWVQSLMNTADTYGVEEDDD